MKNDASPAWLVACLLIGGGLLVVVAVASHGLKPDQGGAPAAQGVAPAADNAHQPTTAEAVLFEYDADQAVMQYRMRTGVEPVQACINLVEAAYPSLRGQDWMKGTTPAHGWVALRLVFQFAMEKRYEQWQEKRKVNAEVWQLLSPEEQNKVTLAFARKHPGALFRVEEDLDPILVKQLVDERARKAGHGP